MAGRKSQTDTGAAVLIFTAACMVFLVCAPSRSVWDTDSFWIIAVGRDILENGIPRYNTLVSEPGLKVVLQEWLYCAVTAFLYDGLPFAGPYILEAVNMGFFITASVLCMRDAGLPVPWGCFVTALIVWLFSGTYIMGPRPQIFTMSVLLLESHALERYRVTGRKTWLIWLPLLMLAEANCHMTMMWFHFAVMAAWLVPLPGRFGIYGGITRRVPVIFAGIISVVMMFCQPYGIDGVMFLFDSFFSGVFDIIGIVEMQAPEFLSVYSLIIVTGVVTGIILFLEKKLTVPCFWLLTGFGLLAAAVIRNAMFMIVAVVWPAGYLMAVAVPRMTVVRLGKNHVFMIGLACAAMISAGVADMAAVYPYSCLSGMAMVSELYRMPVLNDIDVYIRNVHGDDVSEISVCACSGFGAVFEYAGYKVWFDLRPELYMRAVNGKEDIMTEYCALFKRYDSSYDYGGSVRGAVGLFLDSRQFDYIVLYAAQEPLMYGYLETAGLDSGYEPAVMSSDGNIILYERITE